MYGMDVILALLVRMESTRYDLLKPAFQRHPGLIKRHTSDSQQKKRRATRQDHGKFLAGRRGLILTTQLGGIADRQRAEPVCRALQLKPKQRRSVEQCHFFNGMAKKLARTTEAIVEGIAQRQRASKRVNHTGVLTANSSNRSGQNEKASKETFPELAFTVYSLL